MFQDNPLLAQLKQQIQEKLPKKEGTIKATDRGFGFLESDESNQSLLTQLEQHCYLYYSKGVRYLAMGYATDGSAATKWFRLAARYWQR